MSTPTHCTVCQSELQGAYCHNCGQHYIGRRVNAWDVVGGWLSVLLTPERSVIGTFRGLLRRPRRLIHNYWAGFRGYYLSPSQLVVYMLFALAIHLAFVDPDILGMNIRLSGVSDAVRAFLSPQLLLFLMMIPLLALSTAAVYYRHRYSFPEHFTADIYLFALWAALFTLIDDPLYLLLDWALSPLFFFLFLFVWSARVFSPAGAPGTGWRSMPFYRYWSYWPFLPPCSALPT